MSLPVYKAIGFNVILDKGGHSKPWVVIVDIDGSPRPYVVKLYKYRDIEARNKMAAEVLGNVLATEFDFAVPKAAIIEFTPQFCMQLNNECDQILSEMDDRPKFGSEFIEGSSLYNPSLERKYAKDIINQANLYAYDYFICNRDRGLRKTNLLVKDDQGILIDHEMALEITETTKNNFLGGIWDKRYHYHLFYDFLKNSRTNKDELFDEFMFYLYSINFSKFNSYFSQLENMGFNTNKDLILDFWETIKNNQNLFEKILKESIK